MGATLGSGRLAAKDGVARYRYLLELGIQPARLQMSGWFVPEESIASVRETKVCEGTLSDRQLPQNE